MSDVASLELCRELYELSGKTWHEEIIYSWHKDDGNYVIEDFWTGSICPAYDAGYLLRKLKDLEGLTVYRCHHINHLWNWEAQCDYPDNDNVCFEYANTPEDALCQLAIELFKQGVLK